MRSLVGDRISLLVQTFSSVIIAWLLGLIIAWRIAVVIIAVQPLIVFCFYAKKVILTAMSQNALKAQGQGSQLAAEAVSNHRTISAFSSQEKIIRLFQKSQEGLRRESIKQSLLAICSRTVTMPHLFQFNSGLLVWSTACFKRRNHLQIFFPSFLHSPDHWKSDSRSRKYEQPHSYLYLGSWAERAAYTQTMRGARKRIV